MPEATTTVLPQRCLANHLRHFKSCKQVWFYLTLCFHRWIAVISVVKFCWIWGLNCDFHSPQLLKVWGHALHTAASLHCLDDCKWRWGQSDKAGRDERRRANIGLSSEQIQFHSINIDVLLSPTNGLTLPSGHWCGYYTLAALYTLEGLMSQGITAEPVSISTLNFVFSGFSLPLPLCLFPCSSFYLPFRAAAFDAAMTVSVSQRQRPQFCHVSLKPRAPTPIKTYSTIFWAARCKRALK